MHVARARGGQNPPAKAARPEGLPTPPIAPWLASGHLQTEAPAHVWAGLFRWIASDLGDARTARALRATCAKGLVGYDVAVHAGWIPLSAHFDRDLADDEATCEWADGWIPVAPSECSRLGHGAVARLEVRLAAVAVPVPWSVPTLLVCETLAPATPTASCELLSACTARRAEFRLAATTTSVTNVPLARRSLQWTAPAVVATAACVPKDEETTFYIDNDEWEKYTYSETLVTVSLPDWGIPMSPRCTFDRFLLGCERIKSVDLRGLTHVTELGNEVFAHCAALTELDLSSLTSVVEVGDEFAAGCINLERVDFGPSGFGRCRSIGRSAFWSCTWLQHVDLSSLVSLTQVGFSFFSSCDRLRRVNLNGLDNLRLIEDDMFADSPTATVTACNVHQAVLDALEQSRVDKVVVAPAPLTQTS